MDFQDRTLQCLDCKNDFIFTAGEQSFYERKGFREIPKRCKPCRDARKSRRGPREDAPDTYGNGASYGNGNGHGGNGNGNGGGYSRPPREMFDATCASCGAAAQVPFRPASGRPVYCKDCFASRQGQGSAYGDD